MKRKIMQSNANMTLREGCEKYLDNCVQRNLSEFTVLHYRESYSHFYKFFGADMLIDAMTKDEYDGFLGYLRTITNNDRTIRCYQRNLMTVLRYLMREGYMESFEMQAVRVGRNSVETYSDEELQILLKKPDMKKCTYLEYQCWTMVNLLFGTGIRQRSLLHLQVKDNNVNIDIYKRESHLHLNRCIRIPWTFVIEPILPVPVCPDHVP